MRMGFFVNFARLALVLLLLTSCADLSAQSASDPGPVSAAAMAEYHRQLAAYHRVHDAYEHEAEAYWHEVNEKRHLRFRKRSRHQSVRLTDYVLTQPPVYAGPPKPVNPAAPKIPPTPKKNVPVVADFLKAAREEFHFVPRMPKTEMEYKRAYARAAAAAGLTQSQVVRIYAFECGGTGTYDVEAGLEYKRPGAHAITTALGYNQLLTANSVELMAEKGYHFVAALRAKAAHLTGAARAAMLKKIAVLRRMIAVARSVPDRWHQHHLLGRTEKGLAIHAMVLDLDVGPLMETQVLVNSLHYARRHGLHRPLTAAELELMNLTGDGNGFDMVMMPTKLRDKVPTANFFHRAAYARNRIAVRDNTVATLVAGINAVMDRESKLKGARQMAEAFPG